MASGGATGPRRNRSQEKVNWRLRFRRDRVLLLMTLLTVLLILVFNYLPILGNIVAFEDYDPYVSDNGIVSMLHSPWVGLENFQQIFADSAFWSAVQNTLVLFFLQLILFFPIPILLALLINSVVRPRVRALSQAILYLPHFFSWVLVIAVFQQLLGGAGLFSQLLRQHGFDGLDVMTDPNTFKFLITAQSVWKDAGWGSSSSSPHCPPSAPICTRPPRWTARGARAACGTSRCPRYDRSSRCCWSCVWAMRSPSASSRSCSNATPWGRERRRSSTPSSGGTASATRTSATRPPPDSSRA